MGSSIQKGHLFERRCLLEEKRYIPINSGLIFGTAVDVLLIFSMFFSGIICVEGIAGSPVHIDYNCVPSVIYTHPVSQCLATSCAPSNTKPFSLLVHSVTFNLSRHFTIILVPSCSLVSSNRLYLYHGNDSFYFFHRKLPGLVRAKNS